MSVPSSAVPLREAVALIDPYAPGKPVEELARELGLEGIIKMASNESPLGPSPKALVAVRAALPNIHRYPDGGGYYLKQALAQKFGLASGCFTLGNGSSDILSFVLWAFLDEGDEVLTSQTTFLIYPILAKIAHGKIVEVPLKNWGFDLDAMAKRVGPKTKVVFLCNPNNPTGTIFRQAELSAFLHKLPNRVLVVLDEAYMEFVDDALFPDSVTLVGQKKNVVVLRTFSKIVGLAGLRIGYGISIPHIAEGLNRVRPPFNTNTLAQVAAVAALDDEGHVQRTRQIVREGKGFLVSRFDAMGLEHVPSQANFILVRVDNGERVFHELLKKGIIVRSMKAFGLPKYIRVSIGTMAENRRFIAELKKICNYSGG